MKITKLILVLTCTATIAHAATGVRQQEPIQIDEADNPVLHWVDKKADDIVTQIGKGTATSAGRSYHILRHPISAASRVWSRARWRKTYINLLKAIGVAGLTVMSGGFLIPLTKATALYDNNLSSAQLRTKFSLRRLAGWWWRHRINPLAGDDRGSVQNTEKLLAEYAALPADASRELRTIYREELQDMLERWSIGSEDPNPELQGRVEAALA